VSLNLDRSTWKRVKLGDVVLRSQAQADPFKGDVDRYVAGGHIDTRSVIISRSGDVMDGQMGSTFRYAFKPGQVLFVSARPYLRKSGVPDFAGVVADKTYVLDAVPNNGLLQDVLPFLLTSDRFVGYATQEATGSMNPRLLWGAMQRYEFDLPSLDEQKRIADLLWAIEHHSRAIDAVDRGIRRALQVQLSTQFHTFTNKRRIGDVTSTRSGPSFPASAVSLTAVAGSIPMLGIPNTKPDGTIDLSDTGYVTGLPSTTWTVNEASLVLIRTNGNRQRIGNVYLPPETAHGYAVSAFQFLMKINDPADREYVYWVLNADDMQSRMSDAASGTTGLGNLAVKWLNEQEIPWPRSVADRDSFLATVNGYVKAKNAISDERTRLESLRSALLVGIFGGG
jgi:type I restriction enzyme S subunit